MSKAEADAWSSGSKLKGAFFHGTGISERGKILPDSELAAVLKSIKENGFRVSEGNRDENGIVNGAMLGNGVYMVHDKHQAEHGSANRYGHVLELRVNVKNPWIHTGIGKDDNSWPRQYDKITRLMKKGGVETRPEAAHKMVGNRKQGRRYLVRTSSVRLRPKERYRRDLTQYIPTRRRKL